MTYPAWNPVNHLDDRRETVYRRCIRNKLLRLVTLGGSNVVPAGRAGLGATRSVISLAGGVLFGLVWGWLLAQRFAEPLGGPAAAVAAASAAAVLAGEAALLAGRGAALGLLAASSAGALLRTVFSRTVAERQAAA